MTSRVKRNVRPTVEWPSDPARGTRSQDGDRETRGDTMGRRRTPSRESLRVSRTLVKESQENGGGGLGGLCVGIHESLTSRNLPKRVKRMRRESEVVCDVWTFESLSESVERWDRGLKVHSWVTSRHPLWTVHRRLNTDPEDLYDSSVLSRVNRKVLSFTKSTRIGLVTVEGGVKWWSGSYFRRYPYKRGSSSSDKRPETKKT